MVDAEKIIAEIRRLKTELQGYSAREALDYIESYINLQDQSSLPSNLDEEAHSYAWEKQEHHIEFDGDEYFDYGPRYDAFKAGAKWQEEKDQEIIKLAEDHAFLAGADWQKEQMLKEAVEGVVKYHYYPEYKYVLVPYEEFNNGDKVHLIVLKTEEESK